MRTEGVIRKRINYGFETAKTLERKLKTIRASLPHGLMIYQVSSSYPFYIVVIIIKLKYWLHLHIVQEPKEKKKRFALL